MRCCYITYLTQKQKGIEGEGDESVRDADAADEDEDAPMRKKRRGRPKHNLLKKRDAGNDDSTAMEDSLGGSSGSESVDEGVADESSDEDMESSEEDDEESRKEARLSNAHRAYRKALAAQRVRKRLSKRKPRNGCDRTQKKQRMLGKGHNKGRRSQTGAKKSTGVTNTEGMVKQVTVSGKKRKGEAESAVISAKDNPCKKQAVQKDPPSSPIVEQNKQPSSPIVKFVSCEHDDRVSIDDCLLKSCREHSVYLKEPGRYSEYNEKKYLGYQIQDGMRCKKCGVKYKVGNNDGTYLIGKNSSIVMCNSMHLQRECNEVECEHSFCKVCWVQLAEQYAKDHDLSGGVGGRTRRRRDRCIDV